MSKDLQYQLELTRMYQGKQYVLLGKNVNKQEALVHDLSTGLSGHLHTDVVDMLEQQGRILNDQQANDALKISDSRLKAVLDNQDDIAGYVYVFHRYVSGTTTKGFLLLIVDALRGFSKVARYSNEKLLHMATTGSVMLLNAKKTTVSGVDAIQGINGTLIEVDAKEVASNDAKFKQANTPMEVQVVSPAPIEVEDNVKSLHEDLMPKPKAPYMDEDAASEHKAIKKGHKKFLSKATYELYLRGATMYGGLYRGVPAPTTKETNVKTLAFILDELIYNPTETMLEQSTVAEIEAVLSNLAFGRNDVAQYKKTYEVSSAHNLFRTNIFNRCGTTFENSAFDKTIASISSDNVHSDGRSKSPRASNLRNIVYLAHRFVLDFVANLLALLQTQSQYLTKMTVRGVLEHNADYNYEIRTSASSRGLFSNRRTRNMAATQQIIPYYTAYRGIVGKEPYKELEAMVGVLSQYTGNGVYTQEVLNRMALRAAILENTVDSYNGAFTSGHFDLSPFVRNARQPFTLNLPQEIYLRKQPERAYSEDRGRRNQTTSEYYPNIQSYEDIIKLNPHSEEVYNLLGFTRESHDTNKRVFSPVYGFLSMGRTDEPSENGRGDKLLRSLDLVDVRIRTIIASTDMPVGTIYLAERSLQVMELARETLQNLQVMVNTGVNSKREKRAMTRRKAYAKRWVQALRMQILLVSIQSRELADRLLDIAQSEYSIFSLQDVTDTITLIEKLAWQLENWDNGVLKDTDIITYLEELNILSRYGVFGKHNITKFHPQYGGYYRLTTWAEMKPTGDIYKEEHSNKKVGVLALSERAYTAFNREFNVELQAFTMYDYSAMSDQDNQYYSLI